MKQVKDWYSEVVEFNGSCTLLSKRVKFAILP